MNEKEKELDVETFERILQEKLGYGVYEADVILPIEEEPVVYMRPQEFLKFLENEDMLVDVVFKKHKVNILNKEYIKYTAVWLYPVFTEIHLKEQSE